MIGKTGPVILQSYLVACQCIGGLYFLQIESVLTQCDMRVAHAWRQRIDSKLEQTLIVHYAFRATLVCVCGFYGSFMF